MNKLARSGGKFYTPHTVAERLVALVSACPTDILDLCSGPGALTSAALERWKNVTVVTIDDDPAVRPVFKGLSGSAHRHLVADALRLQKDSLGGCRAFDLVLTNPPFGHRPRCDYLSRTVDRSIEGRGRRSVTAEMAALAQALSFTKAGGTVASIMPDTLVAGTRAAWFRHQLEQVAELVAMQSLPSNTFRGTDAKTHLVVLRKRRSGNPGSRDADNCLFPSPVADWRPHIAQKSQDVGQTLADLGVQIVRGATSATKARAERRALFHTDGFADAAEDGILELSGRDPYPNAVEATPGDILLARVDRNIENKVALVAHGTLPISDCVYRLRCPKPLADRVWRWLRSDDGRVSLSTAVRGVSARHLPKGALLNLSVG